MSHESILLWVGIVGSVAWLAVHLDWPWWGGA